MNTHSRYIRIGIIAGLIGGGGVAAVLAVWLLRSSKVPNPESASARDMAAFLTSRASDAMSKEDKYRLIRTYVDRNNTPQGLDEIRRTLETLSDKDIRRLQDHAVDAISGGLISYCRRYNASQSEQERKQIVNGLVEELIPYHQFARAIMEGTPNVRKSVARTPTESFNLALKRISPPELAEMEPMFMQFVARRMEWFGRSGAPKK